MHTRHAVYRGSDVRFGAFSLLSWLVLSEPCIGARLISEEAATMRKPVTLLVAVMILGATFAFGRWTHAQAQQLGLDGSLLLETPTMISGSDIGFRVDRQRDGVPVGALVVRVNGQWVEPEFAATR
jgi:hypothetical protein